MSSVAFTFLSQRAQAAAQRENRVVGGRVYGTVAAANQARSQAGRGGRGGRGRGGRGRGGQARGGAATRAAAQLLDGRYDAGANRRVTEVVDIAKTVTAGSTAPATGFEKFVLNGLAAEQKLQGFFHRNAKILGARLEVEFPLVEGTARWAMATVHKLSAGDKTVKQVAGVRGAQVFDTAAFVDKWLSVNDVACDLHRVDDSGAELLADDDKRHVVFAFEGVAAWSAGRIELKLHVTLQMDAERQAPSDL